MRSLSSHSISVIEMCLTTASGSSCVCLVKCLVCYPVLQLFQIYWKVYGKRSFLSLHQISITPLQTKCMSLIAQISSGWWTIQHQILLLTHFYDWSFLRLTHQDEYRRCKEEFVYRVFQTVRDVVISGDLDSLQKVVDLGEICNIIIDCISDSDQLMDHFTFVTYCIELSTMLLTIFMEHPDLDDYCYVPIIIFIVINTR